MGQFPGRIIAVANQKGGVGKTTTALNLASALAGLGQRTILLDLDPQANASAGLSLDAPEGRSIYNALVDGVNLEACLLDSAVPGLRLVPSHIDLSAAELELAVLEQREFILRRVLHSALERLAQAGQGADFVLIDCPPSLSLLTLNALCAASSVLIPVQCEYYSLTGLAKLLDTLSRVQAGLNPGLTVEGAVLTMFDARTNLAKDVVREVRASFPGRVFNTVIPRSVRLAEAPSFGQPINVYDPDGPAARAFELLACELAGLTPPERNSAFDGRIRINLPVGAEQ
ncbi:ParA family protein [bacterium]|nr:ParA family protein [bacterium]